MGRAPAFLRATAREGGLRGLRCSRLDSVTGVGRQVALVTSPEAPRLVGVDPVEIGGADEAVAWPRIFDRDAVPPPRRLNGDVALDDVRQHAIRVTLTRVAVAAPAGRREAHAYIRIEA